MKKSILFLLVTFNVLLLAACSNNNDEADKKSSIRSTLVTVTSIENEAIEVKQSSVGTLEGLINPTLAAEMAARVMKMHVDTGQEVQKDNLLRP